MWLLSGSVLLTSSPDCLSLEWTQHLKLRVHVKSGLLSLLENVVALATLGPPPGMQQLELHV